MATTGFWPVKGSLRAVVEYANNPDKTTDSRYLDDDLARTLEYAANDSKTDRKMYVSGINCAKSHAYEDMLAEALWTQRKQCSLSRIPEL